MKALVNVCWGLAAVALALVIRTPAAADPRADYMLHCQGCHGPDGSGAAGAVPSFRGQVSKFLQVPGGREYLIRVPGVSQSELDDERIAAVLNWMIAEFDARDVAAFQPFTAAEVARHRRPPLTDVDTVRAELMRR
jgi:mono/diheme cytochrome c family protein